MLMITVGGSVARWLGHDDAETTGRCRSEKVREERGSGRGRGKRKGEHKGETHGKAEKGLARTGRRTEDGGNYSAPAGPDTWPPGQSFGAEVQVFPAGKREFRHAGLCD